jgi:glycosyltransferase involved in cell wall biosynthesis
MTVQPRFSVIICSIDVLKFARISECYDHLLAAYPHEIIGIHDATSLAEGYNRGMARSSGDILIFSHDDILLLDPDFAAKISERLKTYDILGFAGTDRLITATWYGAGPPWLHGAVANPKKTFLNLSVFGVSDYPVIGNIQAIDGLLMIATRETAQAVGFDAATFDAFHLYDLDFSFSAWLMGKKLGVCCDIPVIHESAGNFGQTHLKYAERFVLKYQEQLGGTPPENIMGSVQGRAAAFQDHHALLRAWQPDVLKRATLAMRRA